MTDEGAQRREARQFEPPPWEREQYVELEKRRTDERQTDAAEEESGVERVAKSGAPESNAAAVGSADAAISQIGETEGERNAEAQGKAIDQKELDTMMFQLQAEEPPPGKSTWQLGTAVAVFLALLGSALMLWGMVGLLKVLGASAENRSAGLLVAGTLLFFGSGFIGLAGWLGYKVHERRGVR